MSLVFIFISVGITLFLWLYLMNYFMSIGAQGDFVRLSRGAVIRGMLVAGLLLLTHRFFSDTAVVLRLLIIPGMFYLFGIPYLWKRWKYMSLLPLWVAIGVYSIVLSLNVDISTTSSPFFFLQAPFYEEIGKWLQSLAYMYPAVMSPFVAIGFGFLENLAYLSQEFSWAQLLGRTLFSLPMHLFAGFFGLWCFFAIRPRWLGIIGGIIAAISVHALYNWSLEFSLILTLFLMIGGYVFYGWSLENGWWKKLSPLVV